MTADDIDVDDRTLALYRQSLPDRYRAASYWAKQPPEVWDEDAMQVFSIAVDMMEFYCHAFDGAAPFVLTLDCRLSIRHWLDESFKSPMPLINLISDASQELYHELRGFLYDGRMNVVDCVRILSEPERSFFVEVVFSDAGPLEFSALLEDDGRAAQAPEIFRDAVALMINFAKTF